MADPWASYPTAPATEKEDAWGSYPIAPPLDRFPHDARATTPRNFTPAPGEAMASPGRSMPVASAAGRVAAGLGEELGAAMQGTSPVVRGLEGDLNYRRLGRFLETDSGPAYANEAGEWVPVDARRHVVLRDPQTDQITVFERSSKTDERLAAIGRVLGFGALTNPVVKQPGAAAGGKPSEVSRALRDFDAAGIDPSLPGVTEGRGAKIVQNVLRDVPGTAGPVQRRVAGLTTQVRDKVDDIARGYGEPLDPEGAGKTVRKGMQSFVRGGDRATDMTDAEVLRAPTRVSGFDKKSNTLFNQLNNHFAADEMVDVSRTRQELTGALSRFQNPELGKAFQNSDLAKWADILDKAEGTLSWNDIRQLRTEVGGMLRSRSAVNTIPQAELKRVYGALSDDLRLAAASKGEGAVKAFNRANAYYSAGMDRIQGAVDGVLKQDRDEGVYSLLMKSADKRATRANAAQLRAIQRSMDPDEWGEVASTVLTEIGKPTAANANDAGFSIGTFMTNYGNLSEDAKRTLFSGGDRRELKSALDSLARVAGRLKDVERLGNPSGTGRTVISAALGAGLYAEPASTLGVLFGGNVAARAMMNPTFVRWLVSTGQSPNTPITSHLARLRAVMGSDPRMRAVVDDLMNAAKAEGEDQSEPKRNDRK